MSEVRVASVDGRCDCCMMPYRAGAGLRLELGRYWVLDPHPLPGAAGVSRRSRP